MKNWISVHDIEPNANEPVLCIGCNEEGEFLAPVVATLHDDGKFIIGYRFYGDRAIGFFVETNVTHWMPLPELPIED
jgi:hypothetical protein